MSSRIAVLKTPHRQPPAYGRGHEAGEIVERVSARIFLVDRDGERSLCTQAFGCLVEPEAGDRVLLAEVEDETFVLAVLERHGTGHATVSLPHGLAIESGGDVRIGGATLELAPQNLNLRAADVDCQAGSLTYSCNRVSGFIGAAKLVGRAFELMVDKLVQVSRQTFRVSEQIECVRAGELDCEAKESMRLHGRNTFISADELNKVDARQIHIG